jgi:hypothetical protein
MTKSAARQQVLAERHFPVRVRMAMPARGIGSQFSNMCAWLDRHAGESAYFTGAEAGAGLRDGALFYVVDQKMAAAFVDRFACALIVSREAPASAAS